MRSDKGYRAAGVSEFQSTDFSPLCTAAVVDFSPLLCTTVVDFFPLCTAVAEFDWHPLWKINDLTPIKSSPRLFSQIHISFLSDSHRAPKLPIFCETRLNQACRRRLKWKQCRVPFPLFQPNKGKEGFSGGHLGHMSHIQFCGTYCLNRQCSWRGENGELESKFVNSCLSLLPSARQGQTTQVAQQKDSLPHISSNIFVFKSHCLFLFASRLLRPAGKVNTKYYSSVVSKWVTSSRNIWDQRSAGQL